MANECTALRAVSDAGRRVTAKVVYNDAVLSGLTDAAIAPILDGKGKPPPGKPWGDAEAVAEGPKGNAIVGFETHARIGAYDLKGKGMQATFQNLNPPKEIARGPQNGELEIRRIFCGGCAQGLLSCRR